MGFGILFLGYIFTVFDTGILFIDSISVVFMQGLRLFGWFLVTFGSFKLSRYISKFYCARIAATSLFSISLADSACHIMTVYLGIPVSALLRTVVFMTYAMAYFLFHFYALKGLCDITAEVGLEKENKRAKKLFLLSMAFCAVNFVAYIGLSDALTSIRYILFLIITVLISAFIYTCYMWICLPDENEEDTDAPKKEKKKNGKGKNKNLYIGYITAGFIFLFFPSLSIFDIMPDFIGYLLIIKGTVCLFDLNEDINSARSSFIKLFFINLAKTVITPLLMSLNDETTTMTAVFIFSIIEGILLYSALDSLFVGVNYLAERADSKFADKGYSDVKITTAIFVIGRFVLVSLPELTVLTSLDYQMTDDLSAFTVYDFKLLITIACFVISLILGLHFLLNAVKYIGRLKRDEVFKGYVYSRYVEEVLENKSLFVRRNTKNACTFILAGFIMSCPLYFEGVDVTPSPLAVILLYMGLSRLWMLDGVAPKFKKPLLAFIPLSCVLYAAVCFVGAEYHRWSYQIEDTARFMYKLWGVAQCADLFLFTASSLTVFYTLSTLIKRYGTNENINKEGFQYKEQTKNVTFLNKLLTCCRTVCALAFAIRCVFFFMYPSYEFIWLFSLLLTIIYTVFFGSAISRIRTAVEDNNM